MANCLSLLPKLFLLLAEVLPEKRMKKDTESDIQSLDPDCLHSGDSSIVHSCITFSSLPS